MKLMIVECRSHGTVHNFIETAHVNRKIISHVIKTSLSGGPPDTMEMSSFDDALLSVIETDTQNPGPPY